MHILDTGTLTLLFIGQQRVASRHDALPSSDIAISVITWIEVLQGRFEFDLKAASAKELLRAQALLDLTVRSLAAVSTILPITTEAAAEFNRLRGMKSLKKIGRADLLISCIAVANEATLVTRNLKHFRQVPGLRIENWAD